MEGQLELRSWYQILTGRIAPIVQYSVQKTDNTCHRTHAVPGCLSGTRKTSTQQKGDDRQLARHAVSWGNGEPIIELTRGP